MKKLITILLALPQLAFAFPNGGNGGHVGGGGGVLCKSGKVKKLVTLDYYQASLPKVGTGKPALFSIEGKTESEAIDLFASYLSQIDQKLLMEFYEKLHKVGEIDGNWTSIDLSEYKDHDKAYLLAEGCEYIQIAIRQNEIIYVDPKALNLLTPEQRALIRIHETLYWLAKDAKDTTSVRTRDFIGAVLKYGGAVETQNHYTKELRLEAYRAWFKKDPYFALGDFLPNKSNGYLTLYTSYQWDGKSKTNLFLSVSNIEGDCQNISEKKVFRYYNFGNKKKRHQFFKGLLNTCNTVLKKFKNTITGNGYKAALFYENIIFQANLYKKGLGCQFKPYLYDYYKEKGQYHFAHADRDCPLVIWMMLYQGFKTPVKATNKKGIVLFDEIIETPGYKDQLTPSERTDVEAALEGIDISDALLRGNL